MKTFGTAVGFGSLFCVLGCLCRKGDYDRYNLCFYISCIRLVIINWRKRKECIINEKQNFEHEPLVNGIFANSNFIVIKKELVCKI
jgi:hypothetical protein